MVKTNQIDLTKSKFNLDKTTNNINFVKNSDSLELVKKSPLPDQLNLLKKAPKPPGGFPDINFTEPVDNLIKIPIQPFELYWTDQTAEPDYPDGLPFSFLPIGLEPEIVLDSCQIGIGVQPVLGFIKLPQQQIVYKYAECDPNKPPNPPPPATPNSVYLPPAPPGCWYNTFWSRTVEESYRISFFGPDEENDFVKNTVSYGTGDYSLPDPLKHVVEIQTSNVTEPYYYEGEAKAKGSRDAGLSYRQPSIVDTFTYAKVGQDPNVESFASYAEGHVIYQGNYTDSFHKETYTANGSTWTITTGSGKTTELLAARTYGGEITAVIPIQSRENYITITPYGYATSYLVCGSTPYDYTQNNPPPPPLIKPPNPKILPPPPEDMNCCPQIIALLQHLIIKVNKLSTIVGVEEYPATLPKSLISKDDGWLGNLIPDETVQITSLTGFTAWLVERFDEIMGQWEIPIEIKDSDPTTPGDQPKGFKLSNMAEAQAELMQLAFQSFLNTEVLLSITTRNLLESGQIKQQDFKNFALTQALVDYLGFSYKDVQRNLPLTFTLNKEDFDELLVESEVKIAVAEFDDKVTFKKELLKLLKAAAIIEAVNWRKLDTKGGADVKEQFKDVIKGQAAMLKKLSDDEEDANGDDNLDRYIKDAKTAFSNQPGMPPISQPFGRDVDEGPEIERFDE